MPMFSADPIAPHPLDAEFKPVTTFVRDDVPDYALHFDVPDDYDSTLFAFDKCQKPLQLLAANVVDVNFLRLRYERLFYSTKVPRGYYCVPWMGVPCDMQGLNYAPLAPNLFKLKVKPLDYAPLPLAGRDLKLKPSAAFQANWKSTNNAVLHVGNFPDFKGEEIELTIPADAYPEAGVSVEIEDQSDFKIVGKLRILFLVKREFPVLPLVVEEDGATFNFRLALAADIPESWDTTKKSLYVHGKITDDINTFGFNQIGLKAKYDDQTLVVMDSEDAVLSLTEDNPLPITRPEAGLANVSIDNADLYFRVVNALHKKISVFELAGDKISKYTRTIVLFTKFECIDPETKGITTGITYRLDRPVPNGNPNVKESSCEYYKILPNSSLFIGHHRHAMRSSPWKDAIKLGESLLLGTRHHASDTLTHEISHSLAVNHIFPSADTKVINKLPSATPHYELCGAHQWLRLYIAGTYIVDMYRTFANDKLKPEDFYGEASDANQQTRTMFDDMIDNGFEKTIKDIIDTKIFPDGRPIDWGVGSRDVQSSDELVIWKALNDLVEYNAANGVPNVMDYDPGSWDAEPVQNGKFQIFPKREPSYFNRFQWELLRKAADLRSKIPDPL